MIKEIRNAAMETVKDMSDFVRYLKLKRDMAVYNYPVVDGLDVQHHGKEMIKPNVNTLSEALSGFESYLRTRSDVFDNGDDELTASILRESADFRYAITYAGSVEDVFDNAGEVIAGFANHVAYEGSVDEFYRGYGIANFAGASKFTHLSMWRRITNKFDFLTFGWLNSTTRRVYRQAVLEGYTELENEVQADGLEVTPTNLDALVDDAMSGHLATVDRVYDLQIAAQN